MPTQTSQLVSNLQTIYNTKLEIKSVLGTNSDDFTEYPELIQAAISEGGGGETTVVDPWYDAVGVEQMIENEETTADYVYTDLSENFSVTMDGNEESIEAVEWDFYASVPTGELDQNDDPIIEQKKFHVIVSSNDEHGELEIATDIEATLEDYPDLYGYIYPILENATLTASEDPSEDGYDYLLEGDIYAWNLNNVTGLVEEITENGFVPTNGALGFNVNVEQGIPSDYIIDVGEFDNYTDYIDSGEPIPYLVKATCYENYEYDSENSIVEYDTQVSFDGITHTAHVTISGLTVDVYGDYIDEFTAQWPLNTPEIIPVLSNVEINSGEAGDDYEYYIEASLIEYTNFAGANSNEVSYITSNGTYDTTASGLAVVNVPGSPSGTSYITTNGSHDVTSYATAYVTVEGSGIDENAKYYFFNWLAFGSSNCSLLDFENPGAGTIYIKNLDPINFTDSGVDTHNGYFEVELSKYSDFHDAVEFDNSASGVDENDYQYYGFSDLSTGSNPQFKYIRATSYSWASDIDPETGEDMGSFEQDEVYTGQFHCNENDNNAPYYITDEDEVIICIFNHLGDFIAKLYINGEETSEYVTLTVVV